MLLRKHTSIRSYKGKLAIMAGVLTIIVLIHTFTRIPTPPASTGRFSVGFLIAPLYSSFSRDGVLANLNRKLILKVIKKCGGITFTELKRELGLQNGVLAYHLSLLEKNHYIRSFSDGKYKRFYVKGQEVSGLTTAEELIMSVIRSNPYISRRSISGHLEYSQGTVNSTIKKLQQKELIGMKKVGKHFSYYMRT